MTAGERHGIDLEKGNALDNGLSDHENPSGKPEVKQELRVFGISLEKLPPGLKYLLLASMVFLLSLSAAYCAELVFVHAGDFDISWYLALFELGIGAILSTGQKTLQRIPTKGSFREYAFLGLLFLAARVLTNLSVEYMDYPTHVVVKSAKVIPMMILGFFILGRRYSLLEYVSALFLITGISVFMLANKTASPKFDNLSIAIGLSALLVDALVGNNQEKMMKFQGVSASEVVQYMNIFGFGYCFVYVVLSGNIWTCIQFANTVPKIYIPLILCGTLSFFALSFITTIVQEFGTVVTVMTTSCRKVFTVILSYVFFPKVLVFNHFVGGVIMTIAIGIEVYVKTRSKGSHH